ncbi:hypothetical protein FA95DRAFT_1612822 [Auriscalpium vulgare]|uniref:Uncharacterized protein n=1 Tax=Auriscalpium vulgare TaxID=40419 RepID=A0ACB8R4T5_9AGAM|nr:hypothetical protein FA95DRAFT_1612822 [Auriscalpium vulgare]
MDTPLLEYHRWAANFQRRAAAAVIAFVKDEDEVRTALLYAQAQGLRIAIRGGRHNPAGASSIEDGLVIDLSRHSNGVKIAPEAKRGDDPVGFTPTTGGPASLTVIVCTTSKAFDT